MKCNLRESVIRVLHVALLARRKVMCTVVCITYQYYVVLNVLPVFPGVMASDELGEHLSKVYPVVETGMSDSGSLDNVLEFLVMAGNRSLPEAVMTMVPEAWQNDGQMSQTKRDFYR